ncbi:ATP-binding protein [Actinomadura hibisca]|uniref:ATP-binding protein n=1 Tax=Actinomadura hibisca TaxID=68565 RepID=UPI00083685DD|nr:ATP-binding protein [Actinomadura hibisca]
MCEPHTIEISTDPEHLHAARQWIAKTCAMLNAEPCTYVAQLAVTELIENARQHAGDETVTVRAYVADCGPVLEVLDSSPVMPMVRELDLLAESGRGLAVVQEVSKALGWNSLAGGGKAVFVVLGPDDA